jgi:hypothetical protein
MDGAEARRILDEYFPRKKRFVGSNYSTRRFNIIGFGSEDIIEYKHCPLDVGVRLIKTMKGLQCPKCGYIYRNEEAPNEEGISIKHNEQQTRIVSGKKKKKYRDKFGTEINDPDLIADIRRGAEGISYREELPKSKYHISKFQEKKSL